MLVPSFVRASGSNLSRAVKHHLSRSVGKDDGRLLLVDARYLVITETVKE